MKSGTGRRPWIFLIVLSLLLALFSSAAVADEMLDIPEEFFEEEESFVEDAPPEDEFVDQPELESPDTLDIVEDEVPQDHDQVPPELDIPEDEPPTEPEPATDNETPTDPSDPVDVADPTDATDSTDPTDATDSTDPTDPTEPTTASVEYLYDPQPTGPADVQAAIAAHKVEGHPYPSDMPHWKESFDSTWVPEGYRLVEVQNTVTGTTMWTLEVDGESPYTPQPQSLADMQEIIKLYEDSDGYLNTLPTFKELPPREYIPIGYYLFAVPNPDEEGIVWKLNLYLD